MQIGPPANKERDARGEVQRAVVCAQNFAPHILQAARGLQLHLAFGGTAAGAGFRRRALLLDWLHCCHFGRCEYRCDCWRRRLWMLLLSRGGGRTIWRGLHDRLLP